MREIRSCGSVEEVVGKHLHSTPILRMHLSSCGTIFSFSRWTAMSTEDSRDRLTARGRHQHRGLMTCAPFDERTGCKSWATKAFGVSALGPGEVTAIGRLVPRQISRRICVFTADRARDPSSETGVPGALCVCVRSCPSVTRCMRRCRDDGDESAPGRVGKASRAVEG